MSLKATKEITALPPEIVCNRMAMGLPTVTSPIFIVNVGVSKKSSVKVATG
jgi:hypothetical protein